MALDSKSLSPGEKLLWDYGCRNPEHIDLEAIANDRGARVVYRCLDGCAARLVADGEKAIISVEARDNAGRQRFSLGHELAHWIKDAKKSSFKCSDEAIGPQNAEAQSVEAAANFYASQLVLPDYMVTPWMRDKKMNLTVATELAATFSASVTASAIKLVKGFRINGFVNHYPDFILRMKSGLVVVLETKGDDRDNADSENKLRLGKLWESRARANYRYLMVFEHNAIDGADKLSDALRKLEKL